MAIDIGAEAIDRNKIASAGYTWVDKNNPANASGVITSIEVWTPYDTASLTVGTFYTTNGNTLKCRDSEAIGPITAGSKQTFSDLSITVEAGDYIGCYCASGGLERDLAQYVGIWSVFGEYIDPNDETEYSFYAGDAISLYGIGNGEGVTHYGSATLSGVGALAGIGRGIFIGKSALSGTGTLTAIGRRIVTGVASLTGVGSLSAMGGLLHTASATLSGIGTLTAAGTVIVIHYGAATLLGVGSLTASAVSTLVGKATLTGVGTLTAIGRVIYTAKATLAGVGTLSALGRKILTGSAILSGVGTLSAIGSRILVGVAALSGTGTLTAKGIGIFTGKVTLSGAGALSAFGRIVGEGLRILSLIDGGLKRGLDLSEGGFFRGGLSLSEGGLKRGLCLKEGGFKGG